MINIILILMLIFSAIFFVLAMWHAFGRGALIKALREFAEKLRLYFYAPKK